uniref:Uncharacterized protein n=1 Tax=Arundo donax TaxID=35708 RepID=A0A0A8YTZ6_ARUDO
MTSSCRINLYPVLKGFLFLFTSVTAMNKLSVRPN